MVETAEPQREMSTRRRVPDVRDELADDAPRRFDGGVIRPARRSGDCIDFHTPAGGRATLIPE